MTTHETARARVGATTTTGVGLSRRGAPRSERPQPEPVPEPLRTEILNVEKLEELARRLAALFTAGRHRRGGPHPHRLAENARRLRQAYRTLAFVLAGTTAPERAERALDAVRTHLDRATSAVTRRGSARTAGSIPMPLCGWLWPWRAWATATKPWKCFTC